MNFKIGFSMLAACLALAGCGKKKDEPLEPIGVQQLQGSWMMLNRQTNCHSRYTVFSPNGVFQIRDDGTRKQYMTIRELAVGVGKFHITATGLPGSPETEFKLEFSLTDQKIRLTDMVTPKGESLRIPPTVDVPAATQAQMKQTFAITGQRFAMDMCKAE